MMLLITERSHGVTVIAPVGDLDARTAPDLKRVAGMAIDNGEWKLVIDLARVLLVDSAGLGAIVWAMKRARAAGGDMRLSGLQRDVYATLTMTGLISQIGVLADREAAVDSCR